VVSASLNEIPALTDFRYYWITLKEDARFYLVCYGANAYAINYI